MKVFKSPLEVVLISTVENKGGFFGVGQFRSPVGKRVGKSMTYRESGIRTDSDAFCCIIMGHGYSLLAFRAGLKGW